MSITDENTKKKNKLKKDGLNLKSKTVIPEDTAFSPSCFGNTKTAQICQVDVRTHDLEQVINGEAWQNYGLPKEIVDALIELKFNYPTQIQMMTLPAAVLG